MEKDKITKVGLKHLVPYSLSKLNLIDEDTNEIFELAGINVADEEILVHDNIDGSVESYDISLLKPILIPMADMINDITRNGETFNPIEELAKIHIKWNENDCNLRLSYIYRDRQFGVTCKWDDKLGNKDYYSDDLFIMPIFHNKMKHWIVEKFIEWRFDVFQLRELSKNPKTIT